MPSIVRRCSLLLVIACACNGDASPADTTLAERGAAGANSNAEGDETQPTPVVTGLFHLPDRVDAFVLKLREDGTFRWSISGCDSFGGDKGVVVAGARNAIRLAPDAGRARFRWPGEHAVSDIAEVRIEVSGVTLVEIGTNGERGQAWLPGGVCSICGGTLGPTGQEPCDDPPFYESFF